METDRQTDRQTETERETETETERERSCDYHAVSSTSTWTKTDQLHVHREKGN